MDPSIKEIVLAMLTFLTELTDGDAIDFWTRHYQTLLKECLGKDDTTVYDESTYDYGQRTLIAYLVCISMLASKAMAQAGKVDSSGNPVYPKYVKKSKAGSVEVEFGIVSADESGFYISLTEMTQYFKNMAYAQARVYPCSLAFLGPMVTSSFPPFIVVPWPSC